MAEYIEAAHAVSVSPAPVVELHRSSVAMSVTVPAVLESPVPVVRYVVLEPSVPDLPAPVIECIETAPFVSYVTPALTVYRVMKKSMTEGGGLEDGDIVLTVCVLAKQIVTKFSSWHLLLQ